MIKKRQLGVVLAGVLVAGCGGGGSSGGAPNSSPSAPSSTNSNPTPATTVLDFELQSVPLPASVSSRASSLPVLAALVTNRGQDTVRWSSWLVEPAGDLNDRTEVTEIRLVQDLNRNGREDRGEPVLARGRFANDDQPLLLNVQADVAGGQAIRVVLSVDLDAAIGGSRRFGLRSVADSSVQTQASVPVLVRGAMLAGPWISLGQWASPQLVVDLDVECLEPRVVADGRGNLGMTFFRNFNFRSDVYYSYFNGRYWSTPYNVSNVPETSWQPDIAMDAQGTPVLVWEQMTPPNSRRSVLFSRFDPSSFSWTTPIEISDPSEDGGFPAVSFDAAGVIHVIYERRDANFQQDIAHTSFDGQSWSSIENLSNSPEISDQAAMGIDESGRPMVVWQEQTLQGFELRYRKHDGQSWGPIEIVAQSMDPLNEACVCSYDNGVPIVAFSTFVQGLQVLAACEKSAGVWSAPRTLVSQHAFSDQPNLLSGQGADRLYLSYRATDAQGVRDVFVMKLEAQGWSSAENVSRTSGLSANPCLAMIEAQKPVLVFNDRSGGRHRIFSSVADPEGWDSSRAVMDSPAELSAPKLATDGLGQVHAAWHAEAGGNYEVFYSLHDGLQWSAPLNISRTAGASTAPSIAITDDGRIHIVFEEENTGIREIVEVIGEAGLWSAPRVVAMTGRQSYSPSLVALPGQELALSWSEEQASGSFELVVARSVSGQWSQPVSISPGASSAFDGILASFGRELAAVWRETVNGQTVLVFAQDLGVLWSSPIALGPGSMPALCADDQGQWRIVYTLSNQSGQELRVAKVDANLGLVDDGMVPGASQAAYSPKILVKGGRLHVVWEDQRLGDSEVFYQSYEKGQWTGASSLSKSAGHSNRPVLAEDAGGKVHVAWNEQDGGRQKILTISRR